MSAKHTPGPWERRSLKAANGDECVGVWSPKTQKVVAWIDGRDEQEIVANATMIKEAPNLLKTLQDIAEQLEAHPAYIKGATQEDMEEQGGEAADITWMAQLARAAIAKAVLP